MYFLLLLIIFEIIADIFAKEYSLHNLFIFWITSILCYILANSFWLESMRKGITLSRGGLIFSVSTAILVIVIGKYMYSEEISRVQMIGLLLGIMSLILIMWNE